MKLKVALFTGWTIVMLTAVTVMAAEEGPRRQNRTGQGPGRQQMMQRWIEELNKAYEAGEYERVDQLVQRFSSARGRRDAEGPAPAAPDQGPEGRGLRQRRGMGPQGAGPLAERPKDGPRPEGPPPVVKDAPAPKGPQGPRAQMRQRRGGGQQQAGRMQGRGQGFGPRARFQGRGGQSPQHGFAQQRRFGRAQQQGPRAFAQPHRGRGPAAGQGPRMMQQRRFGRGQQLPPQAREKIGQALRQRRGAGMQAPQVGRQRGQFLKQLPPEAREKIAQRLHQRLGQQQQAPRAQRGPIGRAPGRNFGPRQGPWNRQPQIGGSNFWGD